MPHPAHTYAAVFGSPSRHCRFFHSSHCMWSQCGHGTKYLRWSDARYSVSIRLISFTVGVEVKIILRLLKVDALLSANAHGSPSPSTSLGKASTSSSNTQRHGADLKPVALLAPVSSKIPPGNSLLNIVLPLSLLLAGAIFSAKQGVSLINDSSLCFDSRFAISIVGCTNNAGPGAWAIM